MKRPITDLKGCTLQRRARTCLAGGGVEIVDGYLEYPRLARVTRREQRLSRPETSWLVDGTPANDLGHALRRLAGLPTQMELPL